MAKILKLKLSRMIPYFQSCQSKLDTNNTSTNLDRSINSKSRSHYEINGSRSSKPKQQVITTSTDFHWQAEDKWHVVSKSDGRGDNGLVPHRQRKRHARGNKTTRRLRERNSTSSNCTNKPRRSVSMNRRKEIVAARKSGEYQAMSPARLSRFQWLIPCTVDGKVRESFAVVKKTSDPYDDFKRSMVEMVLEKQMFEEKELEQLLHCFLSLNSKQHHGVIVQAFLEIWEALFCVRRRRSSDCNVEFIKDV